MVLGASSGLSGSRFMFILFIDSKTTRPLTPWFVCTRRSCSLRIGSYPVLKRRIVLSTDGGSVQFCVGSMINRAKTHPLETQSDSLSSNMIISCDRVQTLACDLLSIGDDFLRRPAGQQWGEWQDLHL